MVVVQAFKTKARVGNIRLVSNKIVTSYGKDELEYAIEKAFSEKRMLYLDKKRSQDVYGGTVHSTHGGRNIDFADNIQRFLDTVNYSFMTR